MHARTRAARTVAVQEHRHHLPARGRVLREQHRVLHRDVLLRARLAQHERVHDLKVRRVGEQRRAQAGAARHRQVRGSAHVEAHVARACMPQPPQQ